LHEP